jgi:hypothetical protein
MHYIKAFKYSEACQELKALKTPGISNRYPATGAFSALQQPYFYGEPIVRRLFAGSSVYRSRLGLVLVYISPDRS